MIRLGNIEVDEVGKVDLMLWAKYEQYSPSNNDMTKKEMAIEFLVTKIFKPGIKHAWLKKAKNAVVVEEPEVEGA